MTFFIFLVAKEGLNIINDAGDEENSLGVVSKRY